MMANLIFPKNTDVQVEQYLLTPEHKYMKADSWNAGNIVSLLI